MAHILVLVHRLPYPPNKGDKIRAFHLLDHLARSHSLDLGCYMDDPADAVQIAPLKARLRPALAALKVVKVSKSTRWLGALMALFTGRPLSFGAYPARAMRRWVRRRLSSRPPDLVLCISGVSAHLAMPLVPNGCPVWFDMVDVDSAKWAAYGAGGGLMAALYRLEARRVARAEACLSAAARRVSLVSEPEAELARQRLPDVPVDRVVAIGNGVDLSAFDPDRYAAPDAPDHLVFTGDMDYAPNQEAMRWFLAHVWPTVVAARPHARLVIAGRGGAALGPVVARAPGDVRQTGAVEDMAAHIAAAAIVIAPLQTARGLQNKVLEGMAMARPVVATSAAHEGILAVAGKDLMVVDAPADMADSLLGLMAEPGRARALGERARAAVHHHHAWPAILKNVDRLVAELTGDQPA
ncbi:TIGR03087 family PEP-CTERM/XrtA system glycosyltransferase [Yunchengibacter salinarum]|uniref:TIGR03087 family PEP-CTERM/XrtA system glycosyltransferase n=1 Tax=Yunchengibacter salinarum TaxID=3133399 RepID=UPI0035B60BA4